MAEPLHQSRVLVEKAQSGDRAAFGALVCVHEERLRALLGARLSPKLAGHLEDVYQESLLRAWRSLEGFQWRGEDSFLRWLGGIAEHVILDLARREQRRPAQLGAEPPGTGDSPSGVLRREERMDRLGDAFAGLRPDHRKVLELAHLEGLRTSEIAVRMERSPAAVRQLMWRALKALREDFGETDSWRLPPKTMKRDEETRDG